jgi:hypothetical protein
VEGLVKIAELRQLPVVSGVLGELRDRINRLSKMLLE